LSLCDAGPGRGGSWGPADVIVFTPDLISGLFRCSTAGGGRATPVTTLDPALKETSHRFPTFLPDGHHILYTARSADAEKTAVYLTTLDPSGNSKTRRRILAASSNAAYVLSGYLLFVREGTLMAQRFSAATCRSPANRFRLPTK